MSLTNTKTKSLIHKDDPPRRRGLVVAASAPASMIRLANEWNNRTVQISGVGGKILVNQEDGTVLTSYNGGASLPFQHSQTFLVQSFPDIPGTVAFQVISISGSTKEKKKADGSAAGKPRSSNSNSNSNSNDNEDYKPARYLTVDLYGDEIRKEASQALAGVAGILADTIPLVIDYAIGRPTGETNFEGPGFHYSPMTAVCNDAGCCAGSPTKLQLFMLVEPLTCRGNMNQYGVRSLFGSYWRSQHWDKIVSQSKHLERDETWYFREVAS